MKKSVLIIAMIGLILCFPLLADAGAGKKDGKQMKSLQKNIKNLQKLIDKIQLTLGATGPKGIQGTAAPTSGSADPDTGGSDILQEKQHERERNRPVIGIWDIYADHGPRSPIWMYLHCMRRCKPENRFCDTCVGEIRDNITGLIWLKNANCFGKLNFNDATDRVEALAAGQCGLMAMPIVHSGWRLPTHEELLEFLCQEFRGPTVCNTAGDAKWSEGDPFRGIMNDRYWSSTEHPSGSMGQEPAAWIVELYSATSVGGRKRDSFYVWPVRDDDGLGYIWKDWIVIMPQLGD